MTINTLLLCGAVAGLMLGVVFPSHRIGCIGLLAVPIAMVVYISRWQAAHPENLRSTSALDFVFGPLWPSMGAFAGFLAGRAMRAWIAQVFGDGS